ncbi:MAG: hypothetical protein JW959_11985 [Pirellulales bacterium]|nr:hypothetical protein [Pirellulales bacterium]
MPRSVNQRGDPVNGDSFVDIVACVVSIMIIMVVLEGMRIKNAPLEASVPPAPAAAELEKELAVEESLRSDILEIDAEARKVEGEIVARAAARDYLATAVSAAEHEIRRRRDALDQERQAEYDLNERTSQSRLELERLVRQREEVEKQPRRRVVLEHFPTPLSRTVEGPEAHLLISNGRIAFVPLEPLLKDFESQAKRQVHRLREQQEYTDMVGPIGGFRLRYTLERYDVPMEVVRQTGRGGSYVRLRKWTLIPVSNELGEPVRLALGGESDFRRELAKILPGRTTITIWVYPDGFEAFREVRNELYRLGYSIAARPLPPGAPIGGSPEGTKSAAQ